MTYMVNRTKYSIEYKNKLSAEMLGGISIAEISQREKISSQTLKRWKEEYLNFTGEETVSSKEIVELRKKVGELSVLLADALLEIDILKKNGKIPESKKEKRALIQSNLAKQFGVTKSLEALELGSSTYYYKAKPKKDETWLVELFKEVIEDFPGLGSADNKSRVSQKRHYHKQETNCSNHEREQSRS